MRRKLLAVALLLAFSAPVFAQDADADDVVSDDVDITFWCGAAFLVSSMQEGASEEDAAEADEMATTLFGLAAVALQEDGIEESEHDRLMEDYVNQAMAQVDAQTEEPRYTADECRARAAE